MDVIYRCVQSPALVSAELNLRVLLPVIVASIKQVSVPLISAD
jgi:hypothetical protein